MGAEIALTKKDHEAAQKLYRQGIELGGDDYRARMALGELAVHDERWDEAEKQFLAAERCFPGYAEPNFSAELRLAQLYGERDRVDDMQRARERWLAFNADDYPLRIEVARWHAEQGRPVEAERLFAQANEVDPFRRALHREWGEVLSATNRHEEALREFGVALIVPPGLDADVIGEAGHAGQPRPPDEPREASPEIPDEERAELLGLIARELVELGRLEDAAAKAREALKLDDDEPNARRALERTQ
jgi:tetratricopeptide (TPR) repeat protein